MKLFVAALFLASSLSSSSVSAWTAVNGPTAGISSFNKKKRTSILSSTTCSMSSSPAVSSGNNVVLGPSSPDDENAFDNYKIGTARVHRYSRNLAEGEDAEYVMWYHARNNSKEWDGLPPLSTGRIGRAISKNGLVWKKCTTEETGSSLAEDIEGVSLGLNADSWWGFDTAHVGLGQVLLPMSTPAVITEGGVYLMYYMGGSFDENDLSDYISADIASDAKIKGMKMKIGVALSQDGKAWGRVEGDDPTGAIMVPYDKSDENQRLNNDDSLAGVFDVEEELFCAWPEVVVNMNPGYGDKAFSMYYSAVTKNGKEKVICRAVSEDGFRFYKRGVCLRPDSDEGGFDAKGCARCTVLREIDFNEDDGTWENPPKKDAKWIMLYEGVSDKDGKHRILRAESKDGVTWEKKGCVLDIGEENMWDNGGVGSPDILRMDDGSTRMYYVGQGVDGSTAIGVASANEKMETFTRDQLSFLN